MSFYEGICVEFERFVLHLWFFKFPENYYKYFMTDPLNNICNGFDI